MFVSARPICALILAWTITTSAIADDRQLSDDAWRTDINIAAEKIREDHPRPFRNITADAFSAKVDTLLKDVPGLSDKEIIIRLAAIVATIDDGHTRLFIPRQHPDIGLEFGHKPTPPPDLESLEFKQLPIAFEVFDDGIFITAAAKEQQAFIGYKLNAIDGVPAENALSSVQAITFAENDQLEKLMGADRLSMPEALTALGITKSSSRVTLNLTTRQGDTIEHTFTPLSKDRLEWVTAFSDSKAPLRTQGSDKKHWWKYLRRENIIYAQLNEIGDDDIRLAEFATTIVKEAERRDAKLIIDLRRNFGGSGGLNKTLEMALIQSDELNQYARTFVLTGRRTFSAAQFLVNNLERYTRTLFVGEPTGSRPDHYGDSKKTRLENSGLTLRVSSLHWSSYRANDDRTATRPDLPAPWTSTAYFAGDDPAFNLAANYSDKRLKTLLRQAFLRADEAQLERHLLLAHRAPDTFDEDLTPVLLSLGQEFLDSDKSELASYAYQAGLYLYPDHPDFLAALKALENEQD